MLAVETCDQPPPLYRLVSDQITGLMPLFGVVAVADQVQKTLALIGSGALAPPDGQRIQRPSRLNADGTPFQFAMTLGADLPLQFLCEPASLDLCNVARLRIVHEQIDALFLLLGLANADLVHAWLDRMAPVEDPDLATDDAGPVWFGAAFARGAAPKLKIYVNAKWGPSADRWLRMGLLADHVDAAAAWRRLQAMLPATLRPLGVALNLSANAMPEGRLYFYGQDMTFADYRSLAAALGCDALGPHLLMLEAELLADDAPFATRSAVCPSAFTRTPGLTSSSNSVLIARSRTTSSRGSAAFAG